MKQLLLIKIKKKPISLSPIEVLTDGRSLENYQINEVIFGNREKHKLISMRIYKDEAKIANEGGYPITNPMWIEKKKGY